MKILFNLIALLVLTAVYSTRLPAENFELNYSTYLGGDNSYDYGKDIEIDSNYNMVVTGYTRSDDFPTVNPYQSSIGGSSSAVFLSSISSTGATLLYSTYLGGSAADSCSSLALDAFNRPYLSGYTLSDDFPTKNPFQASREAGFEAFVTRFTSTGSALEFSTYLGGSGTDQGHGIEVSSNYLTHLTGQTSSADFPTRSPYQASCAGNEDIYLTILSSSGSSLIYSTYLGGGERDIGECIALDPNKRVYLAGWTESTDFPLLNPYQSSREGNYEIFFTAFTFRGDSLRYSTYLGGAGDDVAYGISLTSDNQAWLTGYTASNDFPTISAYQSNYGGGDYDIFLSRLSSTGSELLYSSYLGGSGSDIAKDMVLNSNQRPALTGYTYSGNFPTVNPYQSSWGGGSGDQDAFLTLLSSSGATLNYSTYLGGSDSDTGSGIAVDNRDNIYLAGYTQSEDFPTENPGQSSRAGNQSVFVSRFHLITPTRTPTTPTPSPSATPSIPPTPTPVGYHTPTPSPSVTPTPTAMPSPSTTPTPVGYICELTLDYSTYLGGSGMDYASAIAVNTEGSAYITGETNSDDFPTAGSSPFQASFTSSTNNIFVSRFSSSGTTLIFSTYLGGNGTDVARGIDVDDNSYVYLTGETDSTDFPTENPYQSSGSGGGDSDIFAAKLSTSGATLIFSTYLGGSGDDVGRGIIHDSNYDVYITGETSSLDFPTENPYQSTHGGSTDDAVLVKLGSDGSGIIYSTYLGGSYNDWGYGIALDEEERANLIGRTYSVNFPILNAYQSSLAGNRDIFVTRFSTSGSELSYSTYLGGSKSDYGSSIAIDSSNSTYVAGFTASTDLPTRNAFQPDYGGGSLDNYLFKLSSTGSTLVYSTYLGGSGMDRGEGLALDSSNCAYLTGYTSSSDFPTLNPYQASLQGTDIFAAKFNPSGNGLFYSTFLGGSGTDYGYDIAVDLEGNAYLTGAAGSYNFPTANAYQSSLDSGYDAFITKLSLSYRQISPTPAPSTTPTPSVTPSVTPTVAPSPSPSPTPTVKPTVPPIPQTPTPAPHTPTPVPHTPTPVPHTPTPVPPTATPTPRYPTTPTPAPTPTCGPPVAQPRFILESGDYNGDGFSDIAIFRSSSGLWAVRGVTRAYFGHGADRPVAGDYDGDGATDIAIFRPPLGLWAIRGVSRIYFGKSVDFPAPADYNGDGIADIAIFRSTIGLWAVRGVTRAYYGTTGDRPISGNYDGSGTATIGIFRPSTGLWSLRNFSRIYFGSGTDWALPADYDGDGQSDIAIFRARAGLWAIRGITRAYFGSCVDYPIRADFNGNGTADITIFRQSYGLWAVRGVTRAYFGTTGDTPITR